MTYKGIVKGNVIELEGEAALPEGTRVNIIPEQPFTVNVPQQPMTLKEWLWEAHQLRVQLPKTGDSVEILRQLREKRCWYFTREHCSSMPTDTGMTGIDRCRSFLFGLSL